MKKSICILSLIYVGLLANVSYVLAENETDSAKVKESCTIELRKDSTTGAYFFQAATAEDSAKIYIRLGNKSNDPKTYLYTDCDTIFLNNKTGEEKDSNNAPYTITGFDNNDPNKSIIVGFFEGGTKNDHPSNFQKFYINRKHYIAFALKAVGASNLCITPKGTNKLKLVEFTLRGIFPTVKDSLLKLDMKVSLPVDNEEGEARKDSTITCFSHLKDGETTLFFDTIWLNNQDSIEKICLERIVKGNFVLNTFDTTDFKEQIVLYYSGSTLESNADDIVYSSQFQLTPKRNLRNQNGYTLSTDGWMLTKEGVKPLKMEVPIVWKKTSWSITGICKAIGGFLAEWWYLLLVSIVIIVGLVGLLIVWHNRSKEIQKVEMPKPQEPIDPKEIKIKELTEQVKQLGCDKSNLEQELSSAHANLESASVTIAVKEGEIEKLNSDVANLNQQLNDAEKVKNKALKDQKDQLEELFEKDKKEFQTQIQQLKTDNEALSSKVNIGRDELFEQFNKRLEEAKKALVDFSNALIQIPGEDDIYSSTMQNILNDFDLMYSDIANIDANNLDIDKLRNELQQLSKRHLSPAGWMNKIAILTSYSKVEAVNKEFAQHGIHSVALEKLSALINVLLGTIDISLIVPTVLLSKFDSKQYKSTNEEAWIDKYCSEISIYDYSGVVIDIVQVGYSIADKDMQNPIVLYN